MRRWLLVLAVVPLGMSGAACDDDADGDADADSDVEPDGDVDGATPDADQDGEADGDVALDADDDLDDAPDGDTSGEEVCGNCVDEDDDGETPTCNGDEVWLTPQRASVGDTVDVRACTHFVPAYGCVDLRCSLGGSAFTRRPSNMTSQMDFTCWDFEAQFDAPGVWACTFRRLSRGDDGGCVADPARDQACGTVQIDP